MMEKGASPEGPGSTREVARIVEKLLRRYALYFDKNEVLNSDGRRLLATALRYASEAPKPVRIRLREAMRDPSLQTIMRLAETLGIDPSALERGWPYG